MLGSLLVAVSMLVNDFKYFQTRQYADNDQWQTDLTAKVEAFASVVKAASEEKTQESHLQVQLFLEEVVWAVIHSDITVQRAIEFLSKTQISSKNFLQKLFVDAVWLVSLPSFDQVKERPRLDEFITQLHQQNIVPRELIASSLESDLLPATVCDKGILKKKVNQAKTKMRYTFTRYNLLREHTDGYARAIFLLDQLANLQFTPKATEEQIIQTRDSLVNDVIRLTGYANICPNRLVGLAIDVYEQALEQGNQVLATPLLSLLGRLPRERLTEVIAFQLSVTPMQPTQAGSSKTVQPPSSSAPVPPSNAPQFLAIAALIAMDYVDLDVLWSYLEPSDASLIELHQSLMSKHEADVARESKVDLGGDSARNERGAFQRAYNAFDQSTHQKLRLAAALISLNAWRPATRVLLSLNRLCKPVLNHHVRSALCDLLKWLIDPILKSWQKKVPQKEKPTLGSTFKSTRRFQFGVDLANAGSEDSSSSKGVPMALKPADKLEDVFAQMKQVLEHLEYFMETDMHLLSSLWRVLSIAVKKSEKAGAISEDQIASVIYKHMLPAASLVPHNPNLSELMWNVMSQLSVFRRYMIYACWETMYDNFVLKLINVKAMTATKQILKRVVSNADRKDQMSHQVHFHFCKICFSNPIPAMEMMLKDVEVGFNVNMIPPYIECTNRCPDMTADVMGFLLTRTCMKPVSPTRPFLNQADATLSSWLVNLGEFVGRFFKKHPNTDLHGLLINVAKRITTEVAQPKPEPGVPVPEIKGESLIRVILENLIEFMGGTTLVTDMNADQLSCLAGGPRLRSESIAFGKKEDQNRKDRTRLALFNTISELGLVRGLWYSLSEQRCHYTSDSFSEAHGGGAGLKLLSMLFDGNHACFLKLTEFLVQACTREKYAALMPPLQEVFTMLEPSLAFLAIRHGLPPYGKKEAKAAPAITNGDSTGTNGEASAGAAAAATENQAESSSTATSTVTTLALPTVESDVEELEKVCETHLKDMLEAEQKGLSRKFYITFWRLSLQDIFVPNEGYDKTMKTLEQHLKANETQRKNLERDQRDATHNRDYKALKKEITRLNDFQTKLREEMLQQKVMHMKVISRISNEKGEWIINASPGATTAFIQYLLHPRVLTSHSDMLFCCHFVRLMISQKTPGFQLLDFYNLWTNMMTQCIRCCTEREATIFGVFIKEMMSYIVSLRKSEAEFNEQMKGNCVFYRNYYNKETPRDAEEWCGFRDIVKGHAKWEGRIHKALKQGMDAEEWMEKRNVLLLLSQSCEAFPLVTKYAKQTLESVEALSNKEELSDLKTLATSLTVMLKNRREHWFPDDKTEKTVRHGISEAPKQHHTSSSVRGKNALGPPGSTTVTPSPEQKAADAAGSKSDRDRDRGSKRSVEQDGSSAGEKRSRREDVDGAIDADRGTSKSEGVIVIAEKAAKSDHKDHKHSSKEKEPKGDSRKESKRPEGEKRSDKDLREADRKRSSSSQGTALPPPAARSITSVTVRDSHDDRGEKRRRSERDGDVGHGSAGVDNRSLRREADRHGGHSSGSRNALSSTETPPGSQYYRNSRDEYPSSDPRGRSSASHYPPAGGSSSNRSVYETHRGGSGRR